MRLLLFAGTGGAGTTTVAAATALHAARRGVKTLLLAPEPALGAPTDRAAGTGSAPRTGSGALVGAAAAGGRADQGGPVEVEPGLFVRRVDARGRGRRAWEVLRDPLTRLLGALGVDPLEAAEVTPLPGLDDVLTLLEIRDAARDGWDLVVVDLPPLARAVALLGLPESLPRTVERMLPLERRMLWVMGHGASPTAAAGPPRGVVEAAERLQAELAAVREVLVAGGTSASLVLTPDPGALAQARQAWTGLALSGLTLDAVVVNRLVPGDAADPWRRARAAAQAVVLADADAAFAPLRVRRLTERAEPPARTADLADLGVELYTDGLPHEDTPGGAGAGGRGRPAIERSGDDFVLVLPLPLAQQHELDLHRWGDELVVDVAGWRRVLTLPSVLRRCDVVTAALREGHLRVTFRPDPALWRSP